MKNYHKQIQILNNNKISLVSWISKITVGAGVTSHIERMYAVQYCTAHLRNITYKKITFSKLFFLQTP